MPRLVCISDSKQEMFNLSFGRFAQNAAYAAAVEACEGEGRQLEFFGPFVPDDSYLEEALRIGREQRQAARASPPPPRPRPGGFTTAVSVSGNLSDMATMRAGG